MKRDKNQIKEIKNILFLECGTVDMYDMKKYSKKELTLHHEPPFSKTHHTIFEESYLVTRENHNLLEMLSMTDKTIYNITMKEIKNNKQNLLKKKV